MNALDRMRAWFKREGSEVRDAWEGARERADAELSRKEAQLNETPEEAMERIQGEISQSDDSFDELRGRISSSGGGGGQPEPARAEPLIEPEKKD
jgi:ElaB/YqjD/DUF883 family membrane-anchored ribosome-binding protein